MNDRQFELAKDFEYVDIAGYGQGGAARTRQAPASRDLGYIVSDAREVVFSILDAQQAGQTVVRPGQGNAPAAEIAFERAAEYELLGGAGNDASALNKLDRVIGDAGLAVGRALEDIPRHTAPGAVAAHGVAVGAANDKQRLLHALEVEIALRNVLAAIARVLREHVEGKVLGNIAAQAGNETEGVVFIGAGARPAFDVAVRVDKRHLRSVVAGVAIGEQLVTAHERRAAAGAQKIPEAKAARAVRAAAGGEQRIVTVGAKRAVEGGRLGNLRRGVVVHKAQVHIGRDTVRYLVMAAGVEVPALKGALIVIASAEVVGLSRAAG